MRRVQIHLEESLDDAATKEAGRRGISKAALIRRALAAEISPHPPADGDPWEAMIGWLDNEPVEDIDEAIYGANRVRFADTSFWYALQERRDRHHGDAATLARAERSRIVTSNHVVGETWTLLRRRVGHAAAVGFVDRLQQLGNVERLHVDVKIEDDAWRWLRRHAEREYSFVDATSFALMRRRRIHEALAFDGDFSAAGFVEVRPA